jgi:hypothetical protein
LQVITLEQLEGSIGMFDWLTWRGDMRRRSNSGRWAGRQSGTARRRRARGHAAESLERRQLLAAGDVLGNHYDAGSTGQTLTESVLTPANVNATTFGKLFTTTLDGQVYAQPLTVANVNITRGGSQGTHNVVFVATMHNSLYAIDANNGAILWQDSFNNITNPTNLTPTAGVRTIPAGGTSTTPVQPYNSLVNGNDIGPEIGILATPTIDAATNILYVVVSTREMRTGVTPSDAGSDAHFVQRLWAVNLSDGTVAITPTGNPPTSVEPATTGQIIGDVWKTDVTASSGTFSNYTNYRYIAGPYIKGTGNNTDTFNADGTVATTNNADGWIVNASDTISPWGAAGKTASQTGFIAFNALLQMNRVATTLINGEIYLGFASHGDDGPYYGWLLGYNAHTLANNAAFVTVPTFDGVKGSAGFTSVGGLWGSGAPITTDGTYLYFTVGNGSFNNAATNFNSNYFSTTTNGAHVLMPLDGDYGDSIVKVALDFGATQTNVNLANAAANPAHPTPDGTYKPDGGYNLTGYGLKVVDYFTPSNVRILNTIDADLGSGGVLLIPSSGPGSATAPNGDAMLVTAGKEGRIYLIDAGNMGGFNTQYVTDGHDVSGSAATTDPAPYDRVLGEYFYRQANGNPTIFANDQTNKGYMMPSWFNGKFYVGLSGANEVGFSPASFFFPAGPTSSRTSIYASPSFRSSTALGSRGVTQAISANGLTNGLIWNNLVAQSSTDSLVAYSASPTGTVSTIYSSQTNTARDQLTAGVTGATGAKFSIPTVFNGLVYVGTGGGSSSSNSRQLGTLVGYGLLSPTLHQPTSPTAQATGTNTVHLAWTRNAADTESGTRIERSLDGSTWTTIQFVHNGVTSFDDTTATAGTQYFYRVTEVYGSNTSAASSVFSVTTPNYPRGDFNLDHAVTSADIPAMLTALTDLTGFQSSHTLSNTDFQFLADVNGDGFVNNRDIQALLDLVASLGTGSGTSTAASESTGGENAASAITAAVAAPLIDSTNELVSSDVLTIADTLADKPAGPSFSLSANRFRQLFIAPQVVVNHLVADQHVSHRSSTPPSSTDSSPAPPCLPETAVDRALFSSSMFRSRHAIGSHSAAATVDLLDDFFARHT